MLLVEFILCLIVFSTHKLRQNLLSHHTVELSRSILFTVARLPFSEADSYRLNGSSLGSAFTGSHKNNPVELSIFDR